MSSEEQALLLASQRREQAKRRRTPTLDALQKARQQSAALGKEMAAWRDRALSAERQVRDLMVQLVREARRANEAEAALYSLGSDRCTS